MSRKEFLADIMMTFFIITTCIGIAMGVIGIIFAKEMRFGYECFFAPSFFALICIGLRFFEFFVKKRSEKQEIVWQIIYLLLIEVIIFGINYVNGGFISIMAALAVAFSVFIIYILSHLVMWIYDSQSAKKFNRELEKFQTEHRNI